MLQGFGQVVTAASPLFNWLGYGARPYRDAEGAPGTYYVPSKHPYQATLADGIKVQEAYPGQYYLLNPMAGLGAASSILPHYDKPRWVCALIGAVSLGGAGYGGTYYYAKKKMMPAKKKKNLSLQVAAGTALAGAIAGWFMCGPSVAAPPPPPDNSMTVFPRVPTGPVLK